MGASKFKVGSPTMERQYDEDFWVVAAAPDFSWSVVSSGMPRNLGNWGCLPDTLPNPNEPWGDLFILTRQVQDLAATAAARDAAQKLGIDVSVLEPIPQTICTHSAYFPRYTP